ncbi:hypothetical protein KR009_009002 [Drosophila setifemur]|nr:hypothetical protein KR009_009002 [Drosophila setifemur]
MDDTQHFCLRWNNYQSSITSAFENLRDDEAFVDVTLACEGRSIKAHRVVLSACSPYFRDLLKSTPCKHPVILLQDVNFMDLHSLVEFIYHGEVNVHQKSLPSFLKTAEVLRVSGLTQQQAEDTHSHLAQIQNLANAGGRTPLNSHQHQHQHSHSHSHPLPHHGSLHDDGGASTLFSRQGAGSPPPPSSVPSLPPHINNQLLKRMAMMHRSSAAAAEDASHALKRLRGSDNGLPLQGGNVGGGGVGGGVGGAPGGGSSQNSPDLPQLHARSASPQQTPADFSTIKHHNNNNTPPLKEEKRNGPNSGNGNSGNAASNGNGISISDKLGSLTPSPLARAGADDVKSEPMELVCSNNNANANDEHSNDSTGEHDANRSSSGDGGKGSLSSGNDEEIGDGLAAHHAAPPFIMSPAENKMFQAAAFNFPISNLDHSALLGLNTQLQQSGDLAVSPQGKLTTNASTTTTINNNLFTTTNNNYNNNVYSLPTNNYNNSNSNSTKTPTPSPTTTPTTSPTTTTTTTTRPDTAITSASGICGLNLSTFAANGSGNGGSGNNNNGGNGLSVTALPHHLPHSHSHLPHSHNQQQHQHQHQQHQQSGSGPNNSGSQTPNGILACSTPTSNTPTAQQQMFAAVMANMAATAASASASASAASASASASTSGSANSSLNNSPHSINRSAATSPTSSASSPPSPPIALTSPTSSLNGSLAAAVYSLHGHVLGHATSPPRPGSVGSSVGSNLCSSTSSGNISSSGNSNINPSSNNNNNGSNIINSSSSSISGPSSNNNNGSSPPATQTGTPQLPLRMPPPTSGGINEPQECPYCRRTFSCYYSLKRHFQDKHEQSDTLYVCEFCHRRYRTKNSLTTHKSLQHRGSSGMLKRLLKTSAIKHGLVGHGHGHGHNHAHHPHPHHHALSHARTSLFDFTSELGQPPPGIQ